MSQQETLNILNLRCERFNPRLGQYDVAIAIPTELSDEICIHQFKGIIGGPYQVPLPPKTTGKVLWIRNDSTQQLTMTQSISDIVVGANQGVMIFGGTDIWKNALTGSGGSGGTSYPLVVDGSTEPLGSDALKILENGGLTTLDITQQALANFGLNNEIILDPVLKNLSVGDVQIHGDITQSSIDLGVLPVDRTSVAIPTSQQQYSSSIGTGILRNASQNPLLNTAGFPNGTINSFNGDNQAFSTTGSQTSIGRTTNSILVPGTIKVASFGNTLAFTDRCPFDGLQIRGDKVSTTFLGVEIPAEFNECFATINIHVEGTWNPLTAPNSIRCYVDQSRGGVFLRTLNLGIDTRNVGENPQVCISPIRHLVGQGTFGEDILTGDTFQFIVQNEPLSTDPFDLLLIQGGITISRGA